MAVDAAAWVGFTPAAGEAAQSGPTVAGSG